MINWQSKDHEERYNVRWDLFERTYSCDKFFRLMFYLLNSDFLNSKFQQIITKEDGEVKIDLDKFYEIDLSSTQRFMMTFALNTFFGIENRYNFTEWFYQLDPRNQRLILESLKFLQH